MYIYDTKELTIQSRIGVLLQKLKCLLPNDVSLANLNLSGSANMIVTMEHFINSF